MGENVKRYVAVILKEKDTTFLATVPDFGACFTTGDSIEAVKASLPDALALHIEGLREDGRKLPTPRSRHAVLAAVGQPVIGDYVVEIELDGKDHGLTSVVGDRLHRPKGA